MIVKHNNPCGAAEQETLEAYLAALACDPVSAFGGVIAFNRAIDARTAEEVAKLFVECIVAPGYDAAAREKLASKKNLRLMEVAASHRTNFGAARDDLQLKCISGGVLVQTPDHIQLRPDELEDGEKRRAFREGTGGFTFWVESLQAREIERYCFCARWPNPRHWRGQMSRVDSVRIAVMKAQSPLTGSVVASDAYFPFADGVEEAAKAGATAFIQPGGSVRDADVIAAADKLDLAMVFTGVRHFRH